MRLVIRTANLSGFTFETERQAPNILVVLAYNAAGEEVGFVEAHRCGLDYDRGIVLQRASEAIGRDDLRLAAVYESHIYSETNQGIGLGKRLYQELIREAANIGWLVGPDTACGGSTSVMAERVWSSLYLLYPNFEGFVWGGS